MKVLFLKWENFGNHEMIKALRDDGHEVTELATSQEELLSGVIMSRIEDAVRKETPDIVYSFNFFPNVAKKTADLNIDYYSWVYDNPCVQLYSHTIILPTNHIYIFDSDTYFKFSSQGIKTVHFLPMAADPANLADHAGEIANGGYNNDITFVGSLYSEKHNFYDRMIGKGISDYSSGYLRGLMESQKLLYGINLAEIMLTDTVIDDMYKALPLEPAADSVITKRELFAEYVVNRKITAEERLSLLSILGKTFNNVSVYTPDRSVDIPGCKNKGTADPYKETPGIYHSSRINLNISLRSIVNGIPLRCFEIMGAGGFLLTSYAGDFGMYFTDGEDYVSYDSVDDLINKCRYYLDNEDERRRIAANAYEKICAGHTYLHRVREMLGE